jgi:hypothetical protein
VSELKSKYNRPKPEKAPPKKRGNADIISQFLNTDTQENVNTVIQEPVSKEKKVKKATFELDAELHKRLRMFAVENETTMVDVVEKAIKEYLERESD